MPFRLGVSGSKRFVQALSATEPFHQTVHGPHWYLVSVGTRSEHRGQGLGSELIDVGTSRADAAGLPCYLETGTQANIDFYAKRGFEVIGQEDPRRAHAHRHGPQAGVSTVGSVMSTAVTAG